mgnify:CR=1 FL=1
MNSEVLSVFPKITVIIPLDPNLSVRSADNKNFSESEIYELTSVVERINQDYLVLKGRKEVLFKDNKHYVEIQTVVSQKDINKQDTVVSRKLLEPKINVLR